MARPKKSKIKKSATSMEPTVIEKPTQTTASPLFQNLKNKQNILLIAVAIIAIVYYFVRTQFIVAMVNGTPVTRLSLIAELEKQGATRTLDSIITKTLIMQEAARQKIVITDKAIKDEEQKLKDNFAKQGQNLQQILDTQGINQQEFDDQIRLQLIVDALVGKDIKVTDEDVNTYIDQNKSLVTKDTNIDDLKKQVKEQLRQDKLNQQAQTWIKDLRDKAKIQYFMFAPPAVPTPIPASK